MFRARVPVFIAFVVPFLVAPSSSLAQSVQGLAPRQDVVFEVNKTTTPGQSVFVVGDLPELGGNSTASAIKLSPDAYPIWRATISLPTGRNYTYRFITRNDAAGQQNSSATTFAGPFTASIANQARPTLSKTLWLTWDVKNPVLWWRPASPTSGGQFVSQPMQFWDKGAAGRPNDTQYFAWGFHIGGEAFDFYFTDSNGNSRYPASGWYSSNMDAVFVQEGQLYSYVPAASVDAVRRDYDPGNVPTLHSSQLNQTRGYRVVLPRGYNQHTTRRYPVLYMHDGQNIFDQGTFGTWAALPTLSNLQATGQMQEVIVVALDNVGDTRRSDYSAPGDNNGRADKYVSYILNTVKPKIDADYRTLPDPANTAAMGSSMGGVVSLYMGYDWNASFKRVGCMSTAWWLISNYTGYIKSQPPRTDLRIYMDVGDTGSTSGGNNNDGYWDSLGVRDNFIAGLTPKYTLDGRYRFTIGFGQNHNETAWAARLPGALTFLFPSQGEPNTLLRTMFNPTLDHNADGVVDLDDLYAQNQSPRDLNLDGVINVDDTTMLEWFLRRDELRPFR